MKKAAQVKSGFNIERFEPMKMTWGFVLMAVRIATKIEGRPLTVEDLVAASRVHKDLFPRPWTKKQAKYVLDHPDELTDAQT